MSNKTYTSLSTGDNKDIAISYEEYNEMLDVLHDDKFSREGMMRMKNLYEVNSYGMVYVPIYFLPPAMALTYMITGKMLRSHSGYRFFFPLLSITWPLTCWWGYTTPIPRRLYTEILTDPSDDGSYIRKALKYQAPALWQRFSRRLSQGGYLFDEMHENITKTTFPTDLVN